MKKGPVEQARKEIEKTQEAILRARTEYEERSEEFQRRLYASLIKQQGEIFARANGTQRDRIIGMLEKNIIKNSFDTDRARKIREDSRLSQKELGEHLGIPQPTITGYENARLSVPNPDKIIGQRRTYLEWLKERGYNPFNI